MRIDSHQHFWNYDAITHSWIDDAMSVIRKSFSPTDLQPILAQNNVDGCVAVQADQTEAETEFLCAYAQKHSFIKGVVGWVDLMSDQIEERLQYFTEQRSIKGFRHILQGEAPEFMLQPNFLRGIGLLGKYNFTYDILIFPKHLEAALQLVKQYPNQPFVIDHIAKPYIKAGLLDEWKKGMEQLAQYSNVYCKVSGMVTEADYKGWKEEQFTPYLNAVVELFGTSRLMYGSDWPVCLVAADYKQQLSIVERYFSAFSQAEQAAIFGLNAAKFYQLS